MKILSSVLICCIHEEEKFVPVGIASNVLQCELNLSKREKYVVHLESNNFENELYQMVDATSLDDLHCMSGILYTDNDNAKEHPTTKLVLRQANHKNSRTLINLI